MTFGIFGCRSDHRGLATLTHLMWRHLSPAKTLVVDMGTHSPTQFHDGLYGPEKAVRYDSLLAGDFELDEWLEGLDTVLTFEIPYDPRLYETCARRGIKTVEMVMPELDGRQRKDVVARPDVVVLPTTWLAERYPDSPVLPVPSDPFNPNHGDWVVHPSCLAMKDRNGTRVVLDTSLRTRWPIVVRGQAPPDRPHGRATVEVADLEHSHSLFDGAAVVVIPRRYGGLSLVIQEAMSAGLPVLLPESDPYAPHLHPLGRMPSVSGRVMQAKGGVIPLWDVHARTVAERIELVMQDGDLRAEMAKASKKWALANTWPKVNHLWDAVLGLTVNA